MAVLLILSDQLINLIRLDNNLRSMCPKQKRFRFLIVLLIEGYISLADINFIYCLRAVLFSHSLGGIPVLIMDIPAIELETNFAILRVTVYINDDVFNRKRATVFPYIDTASRAFPPCRN